MRIRNFAAVSLSLLLAIAALANVAARRRGPSAATHYDVIHLENGTGTGAFHIPVSTVSRPDSVGGSLSMTFSRNASGEVVDGPVTLTAFLVGASAEGFGSVVISLDGPVTNSSGKLIPSPNLTFLDVPLTAVVSVECSINCLPLGLPVGASTVEGSFSARIDFEDLVANRMQVKLTQTSADMVSDFGLGPVVYNVGNLDFNAISP